MAPKWLDTCLDCGITENVFWDSSIAELNRMIKSYKRRKTEEEKEKAVFDYKLADLVGRSVARLFSESNTMPEIFEIYPTLFEEIKEEKQQKKDDISVMRFKLFAQAYTNKNKNKEVEVDK